MNYKSDLIYPSVPYMDNNIEYAKMLLNVYTGKNSIINNIFMYLYQSSFVNDELSLILDNIINVEIIHAKILSKLINNLGLKPKYIYKNLYSYRYYNTSYINYSIDEINIIKNNIQLKEKIINEYNSLIINIENKQITNILKRLIIDNELHLKIFKELLTRYEK